MTATSFHQSNKFSPLESPISVQMSRPWWMSSPSSEVKESLPFLTWIISYRYIGGNSWLHQQGAVSFAIYRAGKKKMKSSLLPQILLELSPQAANSNRANICIAPSWGWGAASWSLDNISEWPSGSGPAWTHIYDLICFMFQSNQWLMFHYLQSITLAFHPQTLLRATDYKTQE